MNRTLKETLTKLTLETGRDWVVLLPFALFWVRNSAYMLGLTPFETMFRRPPPIVPSLKTDLIADLPVDALFSSLRLLQRVHKDIWKRLEALHLTMPPPRTTSFPARRLGLCAKTPLRHPRTMLERTLLRHLGQTNGPQSRWDIDVGPLLACEAC